MRPWWTVLVLSAFCSLTASQTLVPDRNAIYATQTAFLATSPMVVATQGVCIESAVKTTSKIQITLPALQDILHYDFIGFAKNLAYIVDFQPPSAYITTSPTSITINTSAIAEEDLVKGLAYDVTVADVSVGVRYSIADAKCHIKLGYA